MHAAAARLVWLALAAMALLPRAAHAQDAPRFGLVMGYPAEAGVLWTVSDRVAIRPEISLSKSTTESTITIVGVPGLPAGLASTTATASAWRLAAGASALFYLTKDDALRTYVSPRYAYGRSSSTTQGIISSSLVQPPDATTIVTTDHALAGSVGAQYSLGTRFGVFGELGVDYTHSANNPAPASSGITSSTVSGWSVSLRSGVGVIVYF